MLGGILSHRSVGFLSLAHNVIIIFAHARPKVLESQRHIHIYIYITVNPIHQTMSAVYNGLLPIDVGSYSWTP